MPGPLDGITIVDLTRYQNGPHATVMLSDMGAEIIKVEKPGDGDPGRSLGIAEDGFCSYFESLNRGKKSITLNLYQPGAREIMFKLIEKADVLTENFRPGFLDKLGYGWDDLKAVNPKLIYATNSGFGPQGEWSSRGSFDIVSQGMSGAMVAQAGGPGNTPYNSAWGLADQVGSMVFAYGVMSAIVARERFGVGQKVDVSQLGAMITLQTLSIQAFLHTKSQPTFQGGRAFSPTFAWYECSDGEWLTIGILDPKHWPLLCEALERQDLIGDERSADPFARNANREWLMDEMRGSIIAKPRQHWLDAIVSRDIPCGPVYDYAGMAADQQFWDNGYLAEVEHPNFPGHQAVGIPVAMNETPPAVQGIAPELGQNTEEILLDLGYEWSDLERFHDEGVTAAK